jgi:hypothetical protein
MIIKEFNFLVERRDIILYAHTEIFLKQWSVWGYKH